MRALSGTTTLVGLLRHPLRDSLSPPMQNAAFAAAGLDWAYVALRVEPERLEEAVAGLVALGFAGANVTIPHKTGVLAYCDELDEVAERAGSVNTLVIRDGRVQGSSTDGRAVTDAVEAEGARALVLGAGGAAQAVATALVDAGCASLRVAARSPERAHALAARLRTLAPGRAVEADEAWPPPAGDADLVLNATPVLDEPARGARRRRPGRRPWLPPRRRRHGAGRGRARGRLRARRGRPRRPRRAGRPLLRALDGSAGVERGYGARSS